MDENKIGSELFSDEEQILKSKSKLKVSKRKKIILSIILLLIAVTTVCMILFFQAFNLVGNLSGLEVSEAKQKYPEITFVEKTEFSDTVERGHIISQDKKLLVKNGTDITVFISRGKAIVVDSYVGQESSKVKQTIDNLGLKFNVSMDFSDTIKNGYVISNDTGNFEEGSTILITISKGAGVTVPNLVGIGLKKAIKVVEGLGLHVKLNYEDTSYDTDDNTIVSQSVVGKTDEGSEVELCLKYPAIKIDNVLIEEYETKYHIIVTNVSEKEIVDLECDGTGHDDIKNEDKQTFSRCSDSIKPKKSAELAGFGSQCYFCDKITIEKFYVTFSDGTEQIINLDAKSYRFFNCDKVKS